MNPIIDLSGKRGLVIDIATSTASQRAAPQHYNIMGPVKAAPRRDRGANPRSRGALRAEEPTELRSTITAPFRMCGPVRPPSTFPYASSSDSLYSDQMAWPLISSPAQPDENVHEEDTRSPDASDRAACCSWHRLDASSHTGRGWRPDCSAALLWLPWRTRAQRIADVSEAQRPDT